MADEVIRAKETAAIIQFVDTVAAAWTFNSTASGAAPHSQGDGALSIADIGCGNGYTLRRIAERRPGYKYIGVEQNDDLRAIAEQQFADTPVRIIAGDIRDIGSIDLEEESLDIIVCQRVLINIMNLDDQKRALKNIIRLAKPGAALICIESFQSGLDNLNAARAEFLLEPIPPATHNLLLPDGFFADSRLAPLDFADIELPENMFSTHYFVSRVLHDIALKSTGADFTRNSHFVRFLSAALPEAVGEYSPLKLKTLIKLSR